MVYYWGRLVLYWWWLLWVLHFSDQIDMFNMFLLKFRILLIRFQWFPIIEFQFNPDIFFVPPHGFQVLIIRSHWYRFLLGHIFLFSNRLCRSNVPPSCFMNRCLPRIRNTKSRCIFYFIGCGAINFIRLPRCFRSRFISFKLL